MNLLIRFIIFCVDPLGIGRRFFIRPAKNFALSVYDHYKEKTEKKVGSLKELLMRLSFIAFAVVLIIWAAVFMYAVFYYIYMPDISHTRPLHLQFKTCQETDTPCSFPHAHVSLTKKQQILMTGQAYKVHVIMEMPESPQNLELGMFMVCAEMRDHDSMLRGHSCRSAMMRYRSPLIRTLSTWALSPLFVFGLKEEFQHMSVEIFSQYLEERQHPITEVYVEIQSQKIQFYTVALHIVADFTGLRYIMFNFPMMSAAVGISTNLFFILIIFLLSWYHWSHLGWLGNIRRKCSRITHAIQNTTSKVIVDSTSTFQDDEEISFLDDKSKHLEISDIADQEDIYDEKLTSKVNKKKLPKVTDLEIQQTIRQRKGKDSF